jgi:hypothetical protein
MPGSSFGLAKFGADGIRFLFTRAATTWLAVKTLAAPTQIITLITPTTEPAQSIDQLMVFNGTRAAGYQTSFIAVPSGGGGSLTDVNITVPNPLQIAKVGTTSLSFTASFVSTTPQNQVLASPAGATGAATMRSLVSADIPTLTVSKLSDFSSSVVAFRLDQFSVPTAAVNFNGQKITGLAEPTLTQDAATKNYVDTVAQGLNTKQSCRVASTANITISAPGTTIDGVTLVNGNRVLVKNQTTLSENGIYVFNGSGSPMTRSLDMDLPSEFPSAFTFIEEGTINADTGWTCTTNAPVTVGTTPIAFTQFNGAGSFIDGNGLVKTGNQLDVVGTLNRILANSNSIDIDPNYVGQTSITTLGTITTGSWNGTAIAVTSGGTGGNTAKSARTNLSASGVARGTFTNASLVSGKLTIAHNLDLVGVVNFTCLIIIVDDTGEQIGHPDTIRFLTKDTAEADLTFAGVIPNTWSWLALG